VYKKKYKHLRYKIVIVRIIMKNTFILYIFDIIKFYIFNNMFSQTLFSLTLTKFIMQGKNEQKEYIFRSKAQLVSSFKFIKPHR
jgi:hypothetical protein